MGKDIQMTTHSDADEQERTAPVRYSYRDIMELAANVMAADSNEKADLLAEIFTTLHELFVTDESIESELCLFAEQFYMQSSQAADAFEDYRRSIRAGRNTIAEPAVISPRPIQEASAEPSPHKDSNDRPDTIADPLLRMAQVPVDESGDSGGPKDDEYGPVLEVVRQICFGNSREALHLVRLILTLDRAPESMRGCIVEEVIKLAYVYTEHGQQSMQEFIKQLERGVSDE
jgi:hypothetical protein